jgi:5-methylcytosine-specific restriction endonuclease McrA
VRKKTSNADDHFHSDLFGNITPMKTWEQKYQKYIRSPEWKTKCKEALGRAEHKCQKCGFSKWAGKLEVHHLTYEHFMHEPLEDLIVVCSKCHKIKDRQREVETEKRNYAKLQDARFEGWARAVYGDNWMMHNDEDVIYNEFQDWLDRNDY